MDVNEAIPLLKESIKKASRAATAGPKGEHRGCGYGRTGRLPLHACSLRASRLMRRRKCYLSPPPTQSTHHHHHHMHMCRPTARRATRLCR